MTNGVARSWPLVGAAACATLFATLAAFVEAGAMQGVDVELRRRRPRVTHGPLWMGAMAVTALGYPIVQIPCAAALSLGLRRARVPQAADVFAAACIVFVADETVKRLVHRQRPPGHQSNKTNQSFPSGHTASTAAITLTTAIVLSRARLVSPRKALVAAAAATSAMAESRLVLDEHWTSDVLAGSALGTATALLVTRSIRRRQRYHA
jgi:membrane-associated phospholipid phosphatase